MLLPLPLPVILKDDRQGSFTWNLAFGTDRQYDSLGRVSYIARSITPRAELVNTSALYCVGTPSSSEMAGEMRFKVRIWDD